MTKRHLIFILLAAASLLLASCGDDADDTTAAGGESDLADDVVPDAADDVDDVVDDALQDAEDTATDLVDGIEDLQESEGGGSATFTVGDQTWTFDTVLCAFGEEEIGQEGAEFVLSSIQDGLQMYASIDSFGHSVSLDDVENFADPSVSLSTFGDDDFIVLDGKNVSAEVGFIDGGGTDLTKTPGTFTATCP